jgi:hypothetical protein
VLFAAVALLTPVAESLAATPGSKVQIPVTTSPKRWPDVGYDSQNDVYLAVIGNGPIQGRFLSADGTLLAGPLGTGTFNISTTAGFHQSPRVACGDGVCAVFWGQEGTPTVPMVRVISYTSGFVSAPTPIATTNGLLTEVGHGITYASGDDEFFAAWAYNGVVRYSRISMAGQLLQNTTLTAPAGWKSGVSVVYNPDLDEVILAFAGTKTVNGVPDTPFASVQRIQNGAAVGGVIDLSTGGSTYLPTGEFNPETGKVLVTYYKSAKFYGREVGAGGGLGAVTLISNLAAYDAIDVAYNPNASRFLLVTHGPSAEDVAIEITPAIVPAPYFTLTSNGGNGNYNPRVVSHGADARWLAVTSNNFSSLWGQFAIGGTCTSNCGGGGGGGGGGTPTLELTGLTPSPAPPVTAGTAITWTGAATGSSTVEYQFWVYSSNTGQWSVGQNWGTSATYVQTPSAAGQYAVQVWARLQGSADYLTRSSGFFTVTTSTSTAGSLTLTGLSASPALPEPANTTITWTATATLTGGATGEYQFWVYSAASGAWTVGRAWGASNTFSWTPTTAGTYAVQVWARKAGTTSYQTKSSGFFSITAATTPIATLTLVGIAADPVPSVAVSTSVTWTGVASVTGSGTVEYQFWVYSASAGTWSIARAWDVNSGFVWTPTAAGTYAVQVWARLQGQTAYQYKSSGFFSVTTTASEVVPVTITSLTSTPAPPFAAGVPVTWSATATGPSTLEYTYWMYRSSTGAWTQVRGYSTNGSFVWTPPAAGTYAMQVWVRKVGSPYAYEDYQSSGFFTVN